MSKESYKVPASTKKGSPMTAIPTTLVKGSLWSKTGSMEGGRMLKAGEVGKISVPACSPSPLAKKN